MMCPTCAAMPMARQKTDEIISYITQCGCPPALIKIDSNTNEVIHLAYISRSFEFITSKINPNTGKPLSQYIEIVDNWRSFDKSQPNNLEIWLNPPNNLRLGDIFNMIRRFKKMKALS